MNNAHKYLLHLQELQFALIEMQLYLDTHPYDQRAMQELSKLSYEISMILPNVEKYYGPLTPFSFKNENPSRWITEPWPWELHY